jgi:hypothetical protein
MNMTHYMELLAVNQPWNLILFMAIPVALAEIIANNGAVVSIAEYSKVILLARLFHLSS